MALSFSVTVLPDPPASRLVELMALGERNGFDLGHSRSDIAHDRFGPLLQLVERRRDHLP